MAFPARARSVAIDSPSSTVPSDSGQSCKRARINPQARFAALAVPFFCLAVAAPDAARAQEVAAADTDTSVAAASDDTLPTVTVTSSGKHDDYDGGEVARKGRIGILGSTDIMDAPFNVTNYTKETIENWQARTVAEVLANDPSIRFATSEGHAFENYTIRGFKVYSQDMMLDGLYGLAPFGHVPTEFLERVEIFRGPNALIGGMSPNGAIGGSINLAPKRATAAPVLDLTADYAMNSQFGGHIDVGRRFGDAQQYGVRFNGVYRDGETTIDDQKKKRELATLALDYRQGPLRGSIDAYFSDEQFDNGTAPMINFVSTITGEVPKAPDASNNLFRGIFGKLDNRGVVGRVEYDVLPQFTTYAALGTLNYDYRGYITGTHAYQTAENGDYTGYTYNQSGYSDTLSGEVGLRSSFETGPLTHQIVVSATLLDYETGYLANTSDSYSSNIYDPNPTPSLAASPGKAPKTSAEHLVGYAIADTVSMLQDRLLVTAGVRQQQVGTKSWSSTTGARTADYDRDRLTPSVAVVVKPLGKVLSLYANYIEGLQPGTTVSSSYANAGEVFDPYVTRQYELGAKADWNGFGTSISLFQIKQPSAISIAASGSSSLPTYALDGEQRNRGIELNTYGRLGEHVRLLGGVMFLDAKQIHTASGTNDGNDVYGSPTSTINLGADWTLPWVPKLVLGGRLIHTSSQYLNSANTMSLPASTRVDASLRYGLTVAEREVELRGTVTNLFAENYYSGVFYDSYATVGAPRTALLSATMHF
ncbi:MAG: TonB-dependent siderophore receptor [Solimonas sp.]